MKTKRWTGPRRTSSLLIETRMITKFVRIVRMGDEVAPKVTDLH